MKGKKVKYAEIVLPIKFFDPIYYILNESILDESKISSWVGKRVVVTFAHKRYIGVILRVLDELPNANFKNKKIEVKEIDEILDGSNITPLQLQLFSLLSDYYMCSIGEVYKAAYPFMSLKQEGVKSKNTPEKLFDKIVKESQQFDNKPIILSDKQSEVFEKIKSVIDKKTVLLQGVSGSGKTQLYLKLSQEVIESGKNVLYLVPEIAISTQLEERIKKQFGSRVLSYHSGITLARKKLVRESLLKSSLPLLILGTRSATMLPFKNLGLIIVDEEHDASYKQSEPSPRYNARDAALFLSKVYGSKIILGSATPSLEALYNCEQGLFEKVELKNKYFSAPQPIVIVVDTLNAKRTGQMNGSFSLALLKQIEDALNRGEQCIIFSHLRSYSPFVMCRECGAILKCPHCNVPLSYHKSSGMLSCHYCERRVPFTSSIACPDCKKGGTLEPIGAGSEKIQEEINTLFPNAKVVRYDADTNSSKVESEKILSQFDKGETDILVGTQMISKGFDFANVGLVAVIQTDTILAQQDFRADERALQLLTQLKGRCGRRDKRGIFLLQTNSRKHPLIEKIAEGDELDFLSLEMKGRRLFSFPPFVRVVNITFRGKNLRILNEEARDFVRSLRINFGNRIFDISEPYTPKNEKFNNLYQLQITLKFLRSSSLQTTKRSILQLIGILKYKSQILIDVDP